MTSQSFSTTFTTSVIFNDFLGLKFLTSSQLVPELSETLTLTALKFLTSTSSLPFRASQSTSRV